MRWSDEFMTENRQRTANARAEKTGLPGIARTQGKRGDFENLDGQNRH
jgi:hypothetical protein